MATQLAASFLICPVCKADLPDVSSCDACGEKFETDGGTPRLMSPRSAALVQYAFKSSDSTVSPDFWSALTYPPRPKSAQSTYHLDPAHAVVLESLPAGSKVLEIGCGGGQMRRWVAARGLHYTGTDISKSRVAEELKAHGGPDYLCDAHFLPFRSSSFDLVYSAAVTEHIADPQLMMSEVLRVLKAGGFYLGNSSFLEPWHDDSYFHHTPLGAYRALRRSGFEVMHVWPGVGYSGYYAILKMGNRVTQALAPLGKLHAAVYRFALTLRRWMRHPEPQGGTIAWDARVAGAVDWIAVKPPAS